MALEAATKLDELDKTLTNVVDDDGISDGSLEPLLLSDNEQCESKKGKVFMLMLKFASNLLSKKKKSQSNFSSILIDKINSKKSFKLGRIQILIDR